MSFEFTELATSQDEGNEVVARNSPRSLAPKGNYKVRLHSMTGKEYTRRADGAPGQQLASLFFINLDGNYKGAELTLFRVGGDPATTTNKEAVIAIGLAAGLSGEQAIKMNWAIDPSTPVGDKGKVAAAFGTSAGAIKVEGLELMAYIEIAEDKNGYKSNVVKNLKVLS